MLSVTLVDIWTLIFTSEIFKLSMFNRDDQYNFLLASKYECHEMKITLNFHKQVDIQYCSWKGLKSLEHIQAKNSIKMYATQIFENQNDLVVSDIWYFGMIYYIHGFN